MDALEKSDLNEDLSTSSEEKLSQALMLMSSGLSLQGATFERQNPTMNPSELEAAYQDWLFNEDER